MDDWLRLNLRELTTNGEPGALVAGGNKTSFALIDLEPFALNLPGASPTAQYQGGLVQGISVGWADVYDAALPEQWIDVTGIPSGRYVLEAIVDPEEHIREKEEGNNVARLVIELVQPPDGDAPANDDFAAALLLGGETAGAVVDTAHATLEPGEPEEIPGGHSGASVWWRWVAPTAREAVLSTEGSSFDTVLAVYVGSSLSNLALIAINDDSGVGGGSRVTFSPTAGVAYSVAVDGFDAATGEAWLQLNPAWNDAFSNCVTMAGPDGVVTGSNRGATAEPGEPQHADASETNSLWYCWTALRDGPVTVDAEGSTFPAAVAVYVGSTLSGLTRIDSGAGAEPGAARVSFLGVAGGTYRIAVLGRAGAAGVVRLSWTGPSPPRIVASPASTNVLAGVPASFRVGVAGPGPFGFQWRHANTNLFDSEEVEGTATDTCRLRKVRPADMGGYSVVVSNAYGAVTSAPASLIVLENRRVVYVPELEGMVGGVVSVPVYFRGAGNEAGIQFSLQFEPQLLRSVRVEAGLSGANIVLTTNLLAAGKLGATIGLPAFPPGAPAADVELLRLRVEVRDDALEGSDAGIGFADSPMVRRVVSAENLPLPTLFAPGLIHLQGGSEQITDVFLDEETFWFVLRGRAGRRYAVEVSEDLKEWMPLLTTELGATGIETMTQPRAGSSQRFYRMQLLAW
jgi:hypothetical protein